ncbi:hypothetical protein RLW55_06070 [Hyphomicrobium sp. B1]|uniref:hypothetical protein n=1 Tax=Hyphomicrobium sp. B1 TaxID=3075651 RepID=UPI003C2F0F74
MLVSRDHAITIARQPRGSHRDKRNLERLASQLIPLANQRPTDVKKYAEALLASYVLYNEHSGRLSVLAREHDPTNIVEARFGGQPFKLDGLQGRPTSKRDVHAPSAGRTDQAVQLSDFMPKPDPADECRRHGGRVLTIDEHEALIPLYFRDALANTTLTPIDVVSISFGCLVARYRVKSADDAEILKQIDYSSISDDFDLKSISIQGETFFRV